MIRSTRWRQAVVDADRFLRDWGAKSALGWTRTGVFGAHPRKPIERVDCAGVIIMLHVDELVAVTDSSARIRTRSGALLRCYRRLLPESVPLWELPADAYAEAH